MRRYLPERHTPGVLAGNPPVGDSGESQGFPHVATSGCPVIGEEFPIGARRIGGTSATPSFRPDAAVLRMRSAADLIRCSASP